MVAKAKTRATVPEIVAPRLIRDPAFAQRLEQAADVHPHCPPKHKGRLEWVVQQMAALNESISTETVRKWLAGEAKPRPDKGAKLAQVFEVDTAWLQMGIDPTMQPREVKARNAMAAGAVNLIAGFIQMDGGSPAFPEESDRRAQKLKIDIYAIIKGASYSLHVATGEHDDGEYRFSVPVVHDEIVVLGVVRDGFSVTVVELTPEVIAEHGTRRGASIEVTVAPKKVRAIKDFTSRL